MNTEWTFEGIWPESVPYLDPNEAKLPNDRANVLEVIDDTFAHPMAHLLAVGVYKRVSAADAKVGWRPRRWFNEAMEALGYTEWAK